MIKRISKGESHIYKKLRLAALKDSPSAFASTYEDALLRSDDSWQMQSDAAAEGRDKAIFILNAPNNSAMAAIYRKSDNSPIGELFQMWVPPEARGTSTATAILQYALDWAANHGYSKILAEVTRGNLRALQFYQKLGFSDSNHSTESDTHALEIDLSDPTPTTQ